MKPLLPKIGKKLGPAIPAVMAAARDGRFEIRADGSVALGGVVLAPDEVEIIAAPRPGTAVAHDDGLVVVIDTELTDALRAEGDARELQRAIQDLRRDVGLELDDRIDLVVALPDGVAGRAPAPAGRGRRDPRRRRRRGTPAGRVAARDRRPRRRRGRDRPPPPRRRVVRMRR